MTLLIISRVPVVDFILRLASSTTTTMTNDINVGLAWKSTNVMGGIVEVKHGEGKSDRRAKKAGWYVPLLPLFSFCSFFFFLFY